RNPRRGRQRVNAARGSRAVAASLVVSAVGPGPSGGLEFGAQRRPTPVDAAAYRPHLDAQDVTDLLVAQVLDVAQDDRRPEFRRQVVEGRLQDRIKALLGEDLLRTALATRHALGVLGQGFEPDTGPAAGLVEEQIGDDPVGPPL